MRRSLLFIPGNRPNMIQNGEVLPADALIFDLEDSVLPQDKDAARDLVASALRTMDFGSRERIVRINDLESPQARADLAAVVPAGAETILLPKTGGRKAIEDLDALLTDLEDQAGRRQGETRIIALIETARGIENALEIAEASARVTALALGAEDLSADLACPRTREGLEIFYSRSRLVMAARAAGIEALDTPFIDAHDLEGCLADTRFAIGLGFTGKLCISPFHLKTIHEAFAPDQAQYDQAHRIIAAMRRGREEGTGAVSLDGKMIDPPIVRQAERVIELGRLAGLAAREGGPSK